MKKKGIKIVTATGIPKLSDEKMLISAKELIAGAINEAVEIAYGTAIMGIGDIDELNNYILECIVDSKKKYQGMTKGEFIAKIVDEYEGLSDED